MLVSVVVVDVGANEVVVESVAVVLGAGAKLVDVDGSLVEVQLLMELEVGLVVVVSVAASDISAAVEIVAAMFVAVWATVVAMYVLVLSISAVAIPSRNVDLASSVVFFAKWAVCEHILHKYVFIPVHMVALHPPCILALFLH